MIHRLTSTTGCLCYDPLLKSDDKVQFTHIYLLPAMKLGQGYVFTVSVILLTGGCLPQCMLGYTPPHEQTLPEQTPLRADIPLGADPPGADTPLGVDTPQEQTPPGADIPQSRHPPAEHAGRYSQHACGTHHTGMQSCYVGVNIHLPKWHCCYIVRYELRHCMFSTSFSRSLSLLLVWMPSGTLDQHVNCLNYTELHNILFTYKNNHSLEMLLMTTDANLNLHNIFLNFEVILNLWLNSNSKIQK